MKSKASGFLKQIISVITTIAKAKTLALKTKTRAIKTRLIIFSLLRNKKILMSSVSDKLRVLMGQQQQHENKKQEDSDQASGKNAIVLYNSLSQESLPIPTHTEFLEDNFDYDDENGKYPDLTHSLFEAEDVDFEDPGGSVIDLVKNSKPEGEEFKLEDEIDHVAELFIKRFHRQLRLQKQLSFKRYQEMLERST
ncbi:uncharacterized protein LOC123196554 [Mangifera indica]|uniref:uncharacterized protein LOC123196554 n=1 Tax=Mangifera indica TaxID=29780 RepID=UPI001CFA77DC|nr:uncharacterized protein LOC123196554 [Mangifera indica]